MTNRLPWWISAAVVLMVAVSIFSRVHLLATRPLAGRLNGQEAESHILTTGIAFDQTPWGTHHFLPLTTYGASYNKGIDQHPGAQTTDKLGNFYYVSSPPLTFVVPYAVSKLTGGPSLLALRWFSLTLQVAAAALLAALIFRCASGTQAAYEVRMLVALSAAVLYMTVPEALKSYTISYWSQQFYCVLLLWQIWMLLYRPNLGLLFLSAFVGSLTDWTAYIASSGMGALALYSWWKHRERTSLWVAGVLLAGCFAGGLTMIYWFSINSPVSDYFTALRARSAARSGSMQLLLNFLPNYLNSFGLFALLALLGFVWKPWRGGIKSDAPRSPALLPGVHPLLVAMTVIGFALLENLLMKAHALIYSFDRLKGIQLAALFIAWGALSSPRRARLYFGLSCVLGLLSLGLFLFSYEAPHGWARISRSQQEQIGAIIAKTASAAGPAFFNGEARGSEMYYAQRNLVHYTSSIEQAEEWLKAHQQHEGTLFLISGTYPNPLPEELPRTLRIWRVYADQPAAELPAVRLDERPGDYHSEKTFGGFEPLWR